MSQGKPRGGTPIVSMLLSLVLVLIGLATLQQGVSAVEAQDLQLALLYLSVTVFSFGFVMFSIMRTRRGYGVPYLTPSKVLSVVRCAQCSFKQIKNFAAGEFVFKAVGACTQCGNPTLFINEIYAEDVKKR